MRLFTAIDAPVSIKQALKPLCRGLQGVRWVMPEQIHLTLVFIGETSTARLPELLKSLAVIDLEPFRLECRGIGSFKSGVLWLGVEKQPALIRLEIKIRNLLRRFPEIRLEHRKYHPHITLGRYDRRHPPSLESYLCSYHQVNFEWEVDGFELFSSQLTPKGAIHHCEQRFVASSGSS